MKLLIASLMFSAVAGASQFPFGRSGELPIIAMDTNHFSYMNVEQVFVYVDRSVIQLNVSGTSSMVPMHCLVGDDAPSCVGQTSMTIELPIVKVIQHPCSRTAIAMEDKRPDGVKQTIAITEPFSAPNVRCAMVNMKNPVSVEYKTVGYSQITGREVRATSKFAGPQLRHLPVTVDPINVQ